VLNQSKIEGYVAMKDGGDILSHLVSAGNMNIEAMERGGKRCNGKQS
jgi:hypothetical protein